MTARQAPAREPPPGGSCGRSRLSGVSRIGPPPTPPRAASSMRSRRPARLRYYLSCSPPGPSGGRLGSRGRGCQQPGRTRRSPPPPGKPRVRARVRDISTRDRDIVMKKLRRVLSHERRSVSLLTLLVFPCIRNGRLQTVGFSHLGRRDPSRGRRRSLPQSHQKGGPFSGGNGNSFNGGKTFPV
jgi:hypothetical protein